MSSSVNTPTTMNLTKEVYSDSKPKFKKLRKKLKK